MGTEKTGLRFERISRENREEAEALRVFPAQAGMIETVGECLREADGLALWRPVGIFDGSQMVGFAMYGLFSRPAPGRLWLDRLLIDWKYQGKGYGGLALGGLLDRLRGEYGEREIYLSVYGDNERAIRLYERAGFCFNGEYDINGERVMVRRPDAAGGLSAG